MTAARWMTRLAASCIVFFTLSGCAIHTGPEPEVGAWPPPAGDQRDSVSVILTVHAMASDNPEPVSGATLEAAREEVVRAFEESGLFSQVHDRPAATDKTVELDLTLEQTPWGGITAIIHWTFERRVTLTAVVVDAEGARSGGHRARAVSYTPAYLLFVFFEAAWRTDWVISSRAYELTQSFLTAAHSSGDL